MLRLARHYGVFLVFAAASLAWSEPEAKPTAKKPAAREAEPARDVRARLARPISLPQGIEPNTALREVLEHLTDRQDVAILLDPMAAQLGQAEGMADFGDRPVRLPKLQNVRLSTVLDMVARQTGTAYLVKPGYVEFTAPQRVNPAMWVPPAPRGEMVKLIPSVTIDVDNRQLEQVLRDMAESSGINIVLDTRAAELGKTPVTITLNSVPIDTAAAVLADMSGLKVVPLDNLLYVTTPANARTVAAEQAHLRGSELGGM
jgi:hypothetical protein